MKTQGKREAIINKNESVLSIDIGNTKTHAQLRGPRHELVDEWTVATKRHDSLSDVILQGYKRAKKTLGAKPAIVGLGFGGPVDSKTGAVKLAFVPEFRDNITEESVRELLEGVPVVHLNDVAASAHAIALPYLEPDYTTLTPHPKFKDGPSVLVEIGTGVGTACCLPDGTVLPSEAHRAPASNGTSHLHNLSGDQGFLRLTRMLKKQKIQLPAPVENALLQRHALGPIITSLIAEQYPDKFTQQALTIYAQHLGEYLGLLQLSFLATTLYIGGSVARAPMFLERVIASDAFWNSFAKEDALRQGKDLPILRVNDVDATVRGVYSAALHRLKDSAL